MQQEPLLNDSPPVSDIHPVSKPPSPYWLLPVVLTFSIARGMSIAPSIQLYTDISCQALHDSRPIEQCKSLPEVQAGAARLQATVTTLINVLSVITTGPWSRYGDFRGRRPIMSLAVLGALSMQFMFLLVTTADTVFSKHAEFFIIMGATLDGLAGGLSVFNGVVHAYAADLSAHGSRSKLFSTVQGIVFVGLAIGPWAGGIIETQFGRTYSLFTITTGLLTGLLLFVIFIIPESLAPTSKVAEESYSHSPRRPTFRRHSTADLCSYITSFVKALFSPIVMLLPREALTRQGSKDFNVTFVGAGLFLYLVSNAVSQPKWIYAKHIYEWTSTQLGFFLSLLWVVSAVNLLVILPIIVAYLKPKPPHSTIQSELDFDKMLARWSLSIDATAFTLIAVSPASWSTAFIVYSCLSSLTSGGNPALHSLAAVCLHASGRSSEVGSLYGSLAFLSAVAHIISPGIFAGTYSRTVATFPKAIFYLAAGMLGTSVGLLSFVKSKDDGSYLPLEVEGREEDSEA